MTSIHDDDALDSINPKRNLLLGRYEVLGLLGRGGLGEVLHVLDRTSEVEFALKRLKVAERADRLDELKRTFALAHRLHHPHIAGYQFLERDPDSGEFLLLMEFVEGVPLSYLLSRLGRLPEDRVTRLMRQASEALDHAHAHGVLHRDIKPSNLMVTRNDELQIVDFGLAAAVQPDSVGAATVEGTSQAGTPQFLAPELMRGRPPSPASDQYSLACTAYACLAGHPPFAGLAEGLFRQCVLTQDVDRPPEVSDALWARLARALEKVPSDRWPRCGDLWGAPADPPRSPHEPSPPPHPPEPTFRVQNTSSKVVIRPAVQWDRAAYALDDPQARLLVSFLAEAAPDHTVPADTVLVLDVSGSMNRPERYPLLRKAVNELLARSKPDDRIAIVVFSAGAEVTSPFAEGRTFQAEAARNAALKRMDASRQLFGPHTHVVPGLDNAVHLLQGEGRVGAVRRVYILTDGEIHDREVSARALDSLSSLGAEVNAYGFGQDFEAEQIKTMLAGQIGGSVKPIQNEEDVTSVFRHIADVNRRLVATAVSVRMDFVPEAALGDAWVFRPQERHLGPMRNGGFLHPVGSMERDRVYSHLVELRLPPADGPRTPIGVATVQWVEGREARKATIEIWANRTDGPDGAAAPDVARAFAVLDGLRRHGQREAQLAATRARLELARMEGRDPGFIAAIEARLADLEAGGTGDGALTTVQRTFLLSDACTMAS